MLKDNEIIGWYNGKALTVNENDEISYYEMPEEYAVKRSTAMLICIYRK